MFKRYLFIIAGSLWMSASLAAADLLNSQHDVQLVKNNYGITSLRFEEEQYQVPMAHPIIHIKTINVDTKAQHILNFAELFSNKQKALSIIASYIQTYYLQKISQEHLNKESYLMRTALMKTGSAPKWENYQHWNVMPGYLRIVFDRAQVQPSYFGVQTVDVPLALLSKVLNPALFPKQFELKAGDLLFQDLECGELCDGINSTTYGYKHTTVSHVGMVVSSNKAQPEIIEAVSAGVKITSLNEFLVRSQDKFGHPRVMVGRVDEKTRGLIPGAIHKALRYLDFPYNPTFSPNARGLYCSQLVTRSFSEANSNAIVFKSHPMNFKTDHPHVFSPAWVHYFSKLKRAIPQGQPGNNPGMLSRDPHIKIVYFYGELRPA